MLVTPHMAVASEIRVPALSCRFQLNILLNGDKQRHVEQNLSGRWFQSTTLRVTHFQTNKDEEY